LAILEGGLHQQPFLLNFHFFVSKVSHIIAESNDDFSHGHFELKNFILAQKLEKKATNEGRPLISSIFELQ
jgi:hypothetical protein